MTYKMVLVHVNSLGVYINHEYECFILTAEQVLSLKCRTLLEKPRRHLHFMNLL